MTTQEPTTPSNLFTPFLPTTNSIPEEEESFRYFLEDNLAKYADVINDKKIGVYVDSKENFSGGKWWYKNTQINRNEYQTFVFIPSYPNAGVLTLNLTSLPTYPIIDVNPEFVITNLYGTASKPPSKTAAGDGNFFKFNNQGDTRISFTMSDLQIIITTTIDLTSYSGFIVVSYLRNGV